MYIVCLPTDSVTPPPTNIRRIVVSSTEILIMWNPPPEDQIVDKIISYAIHYQPMTGKMPLLNCSVLNTRGCQTVGTRSLSRWPFHSPHQKDEKGRKEPESSGIDPRGMGDIPLQYLTRGDDLCNHSPNIVKG